MFKIGDKLTRKNYTQGAIWCDANGAEINAKTWVIEKKEIPAPTHEEVRQARSQAYANEVDPLMAEYNRKKLFELFKENEETELLEKIESTVKTIKENNPYPVEE